MFGHVQEYYDASGAFLYENALEIAAGTYRAGAELARAAVTLEQQTHLGYAWNKAYRLDLIREAGLRFEDDVPLVEDILFNVAYLEHVESMVVIPDVLYRYAKRLSGNLTNEFIPRYYELHRRRIREIRDFVASRGALDEQAKATLGALYARFILSSIEQNSSAQAHMNHSMRVTWLEQLFRDELFCELVPCARAQNSTSLAICLGLLNSKNIPALLALGHAIHLVRTRSTTLYTKVKSRR